MKPKKNSFQKAYLIHSSHDISYLGLSRSLPLLLLLLHDIDDEGTTEQNGRLINTMMLIAQHAHTASLENQTGIILQLLAYPAARQRTQNMAMRHNQHIVWFPVFPKPAFMPLFAQLEYKLI